MDGLAETVTVAGVVFADKVAESQVPPDNETATGLGALALTLAVWLAGAAPPTVAVKFMLDGLRVMAGVEPVTVSVTGIEYGVLEAPLEPIEMLPWYVAAASPVVFTETFSEPGVVPSPGLTDSHGEPDATVGMNEIPEPPVMLTDCEDGVAWPI